MMKTYTSKNGHTYEVWPYSEGNTITKHIIDGIVQVLESSPQAKTIAKDGRILKSAYTPDRPELLLCVEKHNDSIINRFAVDLAK